MSIQSLWPALATMLLVSFGAVGAAPSSEQLKTYLPLIAQPAQGTALSPEEAKLAALVNAHRAAHGLPQVPVSRSLTSVAQLHVRDLVLYQPNKGSDPRGRSCNAHSWSDHGPWSPVCYTDDHLYAQGMWSKPREITSGAYTDPGYENVAGAGGAAITAATAFSLWSNDPIHNEVMLEQGIWSGSRWQAMGVGIHNGFAALWFGEMADPLGTLQANR